MGIRERMKDEKEEVQKRIYTTSELQEFDKCIMKYKKTTTLSDGKEVTFLDWDEIYVKAGVKKRYETPYLHYTVTWYLRPDGTKKFHIEEFENKRDQWERWKYGIEKRDESYAKTADEIKTDKVFAEW